jgi:hypothetical protein
LMLLEEQRHSLDRRVVERQARTELTRDEDHMLHVHGLRIPLLFCTRKQCSCRQLPVH